MVDFILYFGIPMLGVVLTYIGAVIRRRSPLCASEGTYASPAAALDAPPGYHYHRRFESRGEDGHWVEHFTVSVAMPAGLSFELVSHVPAAFSASRLDAYSDPLFAQLFAGYVRFRGPKRHVPDSRQWRTALVLALSGIPHAYGGTLTARQDRLVMQMARIYESTASACNLPKEDVVARTRTALERLAAFEDPAS